ncbi:MAG TPA: hypothetical protein VGR00_06945, partial [Thermoanaerobaculia bacterium]|nr:hypothetical protein [Thermoanaerobaculia bacterium]
TRPQAFTIHFDPGNGNYSGQIVPDAPGAICTAGLINSSLTTAADQVALITDHDSHLPESVMFRDVDVFFTGGAGDCWGNGIRSEDPSKTCRTAAVILLSDTFDACGPSCNQLATQKYLIDLKLHHVPVYVISFGDLDNGSATANEAHCIALTSGSESATSQGVFFVSSTDPTQVAADLQAAFDAILTKIDEAVEDFASATVSSVQAGNGQMAFLATFNARKFRSIWDGALRGYVLRLDGAINPSASYVNSLGNTCPANTNPSDCTPCVLTIKDPNDPQNNVTLTVPCNDPSILKWNAQINLAAIGVSGASGIPDLAAGAAITNGAYGDTSNDTTHNVSLHYYPGRRIIWSLPTTVASAGTLPGTLPINGASSAGTEPVPETRLSFLNSPGQTWFPQLKLLLTPQDVPPASGNSALGCATPPCVITDTDAGQTVRFIRGDRDSVIKELRIAQGKFAFAAGDQHYYASPSGPLKMGDIFHSNPQLIGEPENFFFFSADVHNYTDFFNKYKHRRRVLYTGGNDGLLHAFDVGVFGRNSADCTGNATTCYDFGTGAELFAYAPRSVMQNFKRLKDAIAAQQPTDEWTVDGAPAASDMFIDTNHNGTPVPANRAWRTIVVGSQREGSAFEGDTVAYNTVCQSTSTTAFQNNASSIYALDVTAPEPLDGTGNERTGSYVSPGCLDGGGSCPSVWPKVLWEFQDTTQTTGGFYDMGESWSKPGLGRVCVTRSNAGACTDERFVAIFGGGFDRERLNRRGNWLYVVDVETGFVLYKADRGTSSFSPPTVKFASMPSEPSAIDYNGDGFLDVVYIGDMLGQMWRLDLTDLKLPSGAPTGRFASKLTKGDDSALQAFLIFQAPQPPATVPGTPDSTNYQFFPIYYRPTIVSLGLSGSTGTPKIGLAFGTGDRDDVGAKCPTISSNITRSIAYNQRFYFVVDDSNTTTRLETDLYKIATSSTANTTTIPTNGWYLLLGTDSTTTAERVITNSLAANKYIYFFTVTPASSP